MLIFGWYCFVLVFSCGICGGYRVWLGWSFGMVFLGVYDILFIEIFWEGVWLFLLSWWCGGGYSVLVVDSLGVLFFIFIVLSKFL